jgi:hypothetical protein
MVAGLCRGNPARQRSQKVEKSYEVGNPMRAMGVSRENPCAAHILNPGAPAFLSACGRSEKAREGQAGRINPRCGGQEAL